MSGKVHVMDHPLVAHKLTILQDKGHQRQGFPGDRLRDRDADHL